MSERFRVCYPFPIALSAIFWAVIWFCLAGVIRQGGFQPRHVNVVTSLVAWVLYLFAAFVGPFAVLSFSGSLEVDGNRELWKRWFGLSSFAFGRAEIREARLGQARGSHAVRIVLASGPSIRFTQYAWNYTRLKQYLGLPSAAD